MRGTKRNSSSYDSRDQGRPINMEEPHGPRYAAAVRPPRRWVRRTIIALVGLVVIVVGVVIVRRWNSDLDCQTATRTAPDGVAVTVCQREYEGTKDPVAGKFLADALRRSGNLDAAQAIANDLLGTSVRGEALQVLGKIATTQNRIDDAIRQLQEARRLHRVQGNHIELARDDQALVRILEDQEQYAEALQTIDEGISEARAGKDERTEGYCHMLAARVLMNVGYFEASHQELDRAKEQLPGERELAQLYRVKGDLEQDVAHAPTQATHEKQAVAAFELSLEYAKRAQLTSVMASIHLNLAYSLAELGRTDEADRHVAEAGVLDRTGAYADQRKQLAARIAYHRKNYSLASSLNEQQYAVIKNDDELVDICVMQTRIALTTNDVAAAVLWAQRGVQLVEEVRAKQTLSELRPWVLASRREPYELLFIAYARAERIGDAIKVFDQWQGRTLLDRMARPQSDPQPALSSTAARVQSLGRWLPVVSKAPLMVGDEQAALETLRTIDLLGLAVADRHLWRLTSVHGRFSLVDLGPYENLREPLERFLATPTDATTASQLGELLLPEDIARQTPESLYVVLDAPLAGLPFVALRRGGQPLIALRPVLRAPRLPVASTCEPRPDKHTAMVLADAAGDLPDARRESSKVASQFGTTPLVGAAATSTALFSAKSDPVLHIAVHADVDAGGGILKLHDREVSAAEISASKLGPNLVVLSACSTARARDPEMAGALSMAFLAGGSEHVIATLRRVSDAGALELTSRFYSERGADGPEGPVRVLAKIQAALAKTDNTEWPNFSVFGVCMPRT